MAPRKNRKETSSTLPLTVDNDMTPSSSITYANEVVAIIAGLATAEVDGIAGMSGVNNNILSKNRNVTRGVKVDIGTEEAAVDLYVIVEYGKSIQKAATDAQENVRKAIESMTGLHVVRVDVHVQSVTFEKEEDNLLQAGHENAALTPGDIHTEEEAAPSEEKDAETEKEAEP